MRVLSRSAVWLALLGGCFCISLWMTGCTPQGPSEPVVQADTLTRHADGHAKLVELRQRDSLVERRWYRPTGSLRRVERGDSVAGYFDLHTIDSADVLRDYMHGRWRNLSADPTADNASAFYTFSEDSLVFADPDGELLEAIRIRYRPEQRLITEDGISVSADIADFDTVRVTGGYTLVRDDTTQRLLQRP